MLSSTSKYASRAQVIRDIGVAKMDGEVNSVSHSLESTGKIQDITKVWLRHFPPEKCHIC
jgi:hypothetical protein